MEIKKIEACLEKHGFYPMALILDHLERKERYEDCEKIHNIMMQHKQELSSEYNAQLPQFTITKWTEEHEKEYFMYWDEREKRDEEFMRITIAKRLNQINDTLKLNLKLKKYNPC